MNEISKIVDFCVTVISEERTGSRYIGHDINKIWDLGELITTFFPTNSISSLLPKLEAVHRERRIRFDNRLYRGAFVFKRYYDKKEDYIKVIKIINSWGKLRELVPLCENVLSNADHKKEDVEATINKCKSLTYTEVRELFRKFRGKTDKLLKELDIDGEEVQDALLDLSDGLNALLESGNSEREKELREEAGAGNLRNLRLLLSALQTEAVYQKNIKEIRNLSRKDMILPEFSSNLMKEITLFFNIIIRIVNNESARIYIRKLISITFIGNLATYLRALESDSNKNQYLKNKEILNKFISKMSL